MGWFAGIPVNVYVPRPTLRGRVPKPPSSYWFPPTFSTVTVTLEGRHCGGGGGGGNRPEHAASKGRRSVPRIAPCTLHQRLSVRPAQSAGMDHVQVPVQYVSPFDGMGAHVPEAS